MEAFKLYDTFGLPLDFMVDAARDQGIRVRSGWLRRRDGRAAQPTARASWKGGSQKTASPVFAALPPTVFEGYRQEQSSNCEVLAIVVDGQGVRELRAGEQRRTRPRPHAVLRRERWAGGRQRLALLRRPHRGGRRSRRRVLAGAGRARAQDRGAPAHRRRRQAGRCGQLRAAQRHAPPSHGDAPAARRAAPGAGNSRQAGRIAGLAQLSALRFSHFAGGRRRRVAGDRRHRQPRGAASTSAWRPSQTCPSTWP